MAIDFPASPAVNQTYSYNGKTWIWTGNAWDISSYIKEYSRPIDWVTMPGMSSSENKFAGVLAVFDNGSNAVALSATTSSGTYTVDWGDGTSTSGISSGVTAEHQYTYSSLSSTLTDQGYKTVLVTLTPDSGNLSGIDLQIRPSVYTYAVATETGWLDICISGSSITTLKIGSASNTTASVNAYLNMLERMQILSSSLTDYGYLFYQLFSLKSISISSSATVTNTKAMFLGCRAIESIPLFNTSSVTNMSQMFSACFSLISIPLFNTSSVTDMSQMFNSCYALESIPLLNTSSVTTMSYMFSSCQVLKIIPLIDTSNVTNMNNMFSGCMDLVKIPLLNTKKVTNFGSTFNGCYSLTTIPAISSMSVPVGGFTSMFPLGISSAPLLGTRVSIGYGDLGRLSASDLNAIYTNLADIKAYTITNVVGNGTTATYTVSGTCSIIVGQTITVTGITPSGYNVTNAEVIASDSTSFTVANTTTTTYSSGGSRASSSATITVTNNFGTTSDTPSIATNKGWTVTG